jgi:hypothetical protein
MQTSSATGLGGQETHEQCPRLDEVLRRLLGQQTDLLGSFPFLRIFPSGVLETSRRRNRNFTPTPLDCTVAS